MLKHPKTDQTPTALTPDLSPRELQPALLLRNVFEEFHQRVPSRTEITDADFAALDVIDHAATDYAHAEKRACDDAAALSGFQGIPRVVAALPDRIRAYRHRTCDTISIRFDSGGSVSIPAVQAEAARADLRRLGDEIIADIDAAIQAGRDRMARTAAAKARMKDAVREWLANPTVRAIVAAHLAVLDDSALTDKLPISDAVMRALFMTQQCFTTLEPLPIGSGMWRRWETFAREELEQQ